MNIVSSLIVGSLALSFVVESSGEDFEDNLLKEDTVTLVSLDIPWDSGDIVEALAVAPPPPPVEPEPEPEPVVIETPAQRSLERAEPVVEEFNYEANTSALYSLDQFMFNGVVNWEGYKFTYYSQQVLPGGGLNIPGRHVNSSGYVSDGDGYIVLAAPYGIAHGTTYPTPFGYTGKVYDTCASCSTSPFWLDVYIR